MSSNRLMYDKCSNSKKQSESVNQLSYILDPNKFFINSPCRMELGIVGGNTVSNIKGNIVDMETDLRGITRNNSRCPINKNSWIEKNGQIKIPAQLSKCELVIDTKKQHLPPCQMINYDPVELPEPYNMPNCKPPAYQMQFSKNNMS